MTPSDVLTLVLAALLLVTLWNAAAAPRLHAPRANAPPQRLRASLLVPVRNEARGVAAMLRAALHQGSADEILVLDDESTDGTRAIVAALQRESGGRVRLHLGTPLPPGWVGKNWACHQLAAHASGDVLVFCDADVTLTADAVGATLALMECTGADVATALPAHAYRGWWDRAVIPLVLHFPLLASLPLPLLPRTNAPSLAFGNGQWLAFRREAYARVGGHAAVRDRIVEDMALVRRARQLRLRTAAALAPAFLRVRMYDTRAALVEGFTKNLYLLLGGAPLPALALATGFVTLSAAPLALAATGTLAPLALLLAIRAVHARITGGRILDLALHPPGVVLALWIVLRSAVAHRAGRITWKSRTVAWKQV